jgi:arylsulfatase A-like enzyme
MDDAVGRVVAALKKAGVWENTLIFFISDNGGPLALSANNAPLRGGKHQLFEGGVRVPFVVCWPSRLKPGQTREVVSSLDILPSALAAAKIESPAGDPFDGIDILPMLRGEKPAVPRNLFWNAGGADGWWTVRSGDWKLSTLRGRSSLFDLGVDISESNDLAGGPTEQVAAMTRLYESWRAQMAGPRGALNARRAEAGADGAGTRRPRAGRRPRQGATTRKAGRDGQD